MYNVMVCLSYIHCIFFVNYSYNDTPFSVGVILIEVPCHHPAIKQADSIPYLIKHIYLPAYNVFGKWNVKLEVWKK